MPWILRYVAIKSTLDPVEVPLSELEDFWRLVKHDFPEAEHYLAFPAHDISLLINQVSSCID